LNELTLPDAAWFPNDKKGSDERSPSVSNQMNDFANFAGATIRWIWSKGNRGTNQVRRAD